MKFDINNYKGRYYAMHCKTEEEARDFCNYLHSIGRKWSANNPYNKNTMYSMYENETAYAFNVDEYSSVSYCKENGYTILEFSDFNWSKEFTKVDLKTGDVVLRRDESVGIVFREFESLIHKSGWNTLEDVNEDLTNIFNRSYDIVAVRRPKKGHECRFDAFKLELGTLVYEEVEEMTLAEVCKLLGKNIKIIQ